MFRIKFFIIINSISIFICSCYNYGKTHEPYTIDYRKPNLPPPPVKITGKPLNKKEYIEKTYKEIKDNIQEAEVVLIEDSIKVLFPNNILYNAKDVIPYTDYMGPLEKFAGLLKKYNKTNIMVSGHTDNKGKESLNKELSEQRAKNIKNTLIDLGIGNYRLYSVGLGSYSPIESNKTEEGRKINRRVEFIVLYRE